MSNEATDTHDDDEGGSNTSALSSWLNLTQSTAVLLDRKSCIESYWSDNARPDGRLLLQCRPTHIQCGILGRGGGGGNSGIGGSALVRLGSTHVMAVISLQVGQVVSTSSTTAASTSRSATSAGSYNPKQLSGDIVVTCSTNSPSFLPSYLQRILEETTDLEQLVLMNNNSSAAAAAASNQDIGTKTPRQQQQRSMAWRLCCSVQIVQDAGNLRDACLLACTAALNDTKLPLDDNATLGAEANNNNNQGGSAIVAVWEQDRLWLKKTTTSTTTSLPVQSSTSTASSSSQRHLFKPLRCPMLPVALTVGVWNNYLSPDSTDDDPSVNNNHDNNNILMIVDPTKQEEGALSTRITVVVNAAAAAVKQTDDEKAFSSTNKSLNSQALLSLEVTGGTVPEGFGGAGAVNMSTLALAVKLAQGRARELYPILVSQQQQ